MDQLYVDCVADPLDVTISSVTIQDITASLGNDVTGNQANQGLSTEPLQGRDLEIATSSPSVVKTGEDNETMDVKSTAVVKYSGIPMPGYQKLQINTDLNAPPANWLQGTSKWHTYMRNVSLGRSANCHGRNSAWNSCLPQVDTELREAAAAATRQTESSPAQPFTANSFQMAYCFPDLAGDIDVISDAENMKRLLKMPYSSGQVSMMVHRVDNTILLDDFDVHKHLLRRQETDWQWLRKFYYETVVRDMQRKLSDKCVLKKNKSRDHLQNRNMFSKFLYYSIAEGEEEELSECVSPADRRLNTSSYQCMPDPLPECQPDTTEHQRSVLWQFEDIHMLIGSDLPIFGGRTHPCVSLRLRDMRKPITVLTGLDYWLDNLMCNVPELAMCYHLNGIVQDYEILKTEDLPNWRDSKFSPQVIKDTAQNILSFLKTNATKEGHTYWLFKGQGDDVVKLYDLSTLCADSLNERTNNPFTVPVGILLYRVARNMRQTRGREKSGTIKALLDNCLLLLDSELHSQVFTSAHYLLSDLYVADSIFETDNNTSSDSDSDAESEQGADDKSEEKEEVEDEVKEEVQVTKEVTIEVTKYNPSCQGAPVSCHDDAPCPLDNGDDALSPSCVEVAELSQIKVKCEDQENGKMPRHPSITGSTEERCLEALRHIAEGLSCLDKSIEEGSHQEPVKTFNPSEPIPMHYQSLSSMKESTNEAAESSANQSSAAEIPANQSSASEISANENTGSEVTVYSKSMPAGSWHSQSKVLLFRKATICYYKLAERSLSQRKFNQTLHYLSLGLRCFGSLKVLSNNKATENTHLLIAMLALAGDAHLLMLGDHNANKHNPEDKPELSQLDESVLKSTVGHGISFEYTTLVDLCPDPEMHLERSLEAFQQAMDLTEESSLSAEQVCLLMKRYGNVCNELGVYKMNRAASFLGAESSEDAVKEECREKVMMLAMQSWKCMEQSLEAFSGVGDAVNKALIHCNMGRLMRVCVQAQANDDLERQKHYYRRAQENYQQALRQLPPSGTSSVMRESVQWELCSTYYFLGCLLQDNGVTESSAQQDVEKEVIDLMMKSLKHCAMEGERSKVQQHQERAAAINHRLASLYHNAYRKPQGSDSRKKQMRSLAEIHYGKASSLLEPLHKPCQLLRVQLERIALSEHQLAGLTSSAARLRLLQTTLTSQLLACRSVMEQLLEQLTAAAANHQGEPPTEDEEALTLMEIWQSRLNAVLLDLLKITQQSTGKKKSSPGSNITAPTSKYKTMYTAALRESSNKKTAPFTRCQHLVELIDAIQKLNQSEESGSVT